MIRRRWSGCAQHPRQEPASHGRICCRGYERALYDGARARGAHATYTAIDVRRHPEMSVVVPDGTEAVDYEGPRGPTWAAGTTEACRGVLRAAGYRVAAARAAAREEVES